MIKYFLKKKFRKDEYGWFGNYSSWQEAATISDGYCKASILEKTKNALLKIKNGEAIYERDSVLFDKKEHPFPLLSCLLRTAWEKGTPLNILDFGGSLGSTYFQIKDFLPADVCVTWCIVEQNHYVECGRDLFENSTLKFFYSIEECLAATKIDLIILSGVIQFLPDPHHFLHRLTSYGFKTILFDRTPFIRDNKDRLTVQKVWPSVYEASYPAWFFHEASFIQHFEHDYCIKGDFKTYVEGESILQINNEPIGYSKGICLVKK
ncbi:methyltransferase, TIGR04325 family (plasmid) [Chitinophaga sp. Mgbs1]|uniref:Methyltransferase, TIGR04325 family n=1 Tax=Chitinophaga solisilvae TaxID=1233460 RepID=A0A3S1D3R7_9BACT|nr:methyltransferase, TIGR04325 family [Chitinophaga solisilvae]